MLQHISQLYDDKIGAIDGDIGHVEDMYFDDRTWAIRYLVTDTGSWLSGRKVLIAPHAFGGVDREGKQLMVKLTKAQVEASPPVESDKPVSRQYEERYYLHYGFPFYWQGNGLWGMSGFPITNLTAIDLPDAIVSTESSAPLKDDDPNLRSTQAIKGYQIMATDGTVGHVTDFIMDDKSWCILQVVVKTGGWLSDRKVVINTAIVDRISYVESLIYVSATREEVRNGLPLTEEPVTA